ncbi:hypothetical protein ACPOL_1065 [Acidisarcina polymorpha]|uniref:Negative regulator of flagellin synthesis n=1 Tax=Acidisarcina polymorpha TaxID=2211140 RepID=A0A2Z5FVG9_9BACT|nr:flagellar biosynthesis anti-sigma factor FlgM [Acidisarcina polymorpha]AXC10416.1 hypothetical protein ACPOL_1065 [Acidisarcina polymorpha]
MSIQWNSSSPQSIPKDTTVIRTAGASFKPTETIEPSNSHPSLDGDAAHLSPAALLASASSSLPDVRSEKVASIQEALANGSYSVSSTDVADKLIDHLLHS